MDAEAILQTARQPGDPPENWTVIPLNTRVVRRTLLGWIGGAFVGYVLFALLLSVVYNSLSFIPVILLAILLFVGIGSTMLIVKNFRMLADADRHIIVMTPEFYVQQRRETIIMVPMRDITNITLRGVFGGDASVVQAQDLNVDNAVMNFGRFMGGSAHRRQRRTPDSLAFVDARTETVITVSDDNSHTDLPVLDELLHNYVEAARRARKS